MPIAVVEIVRMRLVIRELIQVRGMVSVQAVPLHLISRELSGEKSGQDACDRKEIYFPRVCR